MLTVDHSAMQVEQHETDADLARQLQAMQMQVADLMLEVEKMKVAAASQTSAYQVDVLLCFAT